MLLALFVEHWACELVVESKGYVIINWFILTSKYVTLRLSMLDLKSTL